MPAEDVLDKVNPGPFGATVTNFSAVSKVGKNPADAAGEKDFTRPDSERSSGSTMFGEGSIGKVRYAGLAFMLQEAKLMNLQTPAGEFFAQPQVGEFLERKYPGQGPQLQSEIGKLFAGDSAVATLADLTTHRSGIGDLTKDQAKLMAQEGIEHPFSVPELLLVERDPELSANGKPKVQTAPHLPDAKYGEHQYSNLGYMLLGLAMEASYDIAKNPSGEKPIKDYKQLTRDFMLDPKEGPAVGKVTPFSQTKFPEDLSPGDDLARSSWLEKDKMVDATKFSGANSAGGILVSADDSTRFFGEFFKGFPGTPAAENPFFSPETIGLMVEEGKKFLSCGINNSPDLTRQGNERFQAPGFVFEVDKESGKPITFEKAGGTFGYASFLNVDAKTGEAKIDMCAQENITGEIAKKIGAEKGDVFVGESAQEIAKQRCEKTKKIVEEYRDPESGKFDREKMIESEMPQVAQQLAVRNALSALKENSASASVDASPTAQSDIQRSDGNFASK